MSMQFTKKVGMRGSLTKCSIYVTIPKDYVEAYDIKPGDKVTFDIIRVLKGKIKSE